MARQTGEPGEPCTDDFDAEMTAFGVEATVPGVGGGVISDLERIGLQRGLQKRMNAVSAALRRHGLQAFSSSFICLDSKSDWPITNTKVRIRLPNSLKSTPRSVEKL